MTQIFPEPLLIIILYIISYIINGHWSICSNVWSKGISINYCVRLSIKPQIIISWIGLLSKLSRLISDHFIHCYLIWKGGIWFKPALERVLFSAVEFIEFLEELWVGLLESICLLASEFLISDKLDVGWVRIHLRGKLDRFF